MREECFQHQADVKGRPSAQRDPHTPSTGCVRDGAPFNKGLYILLNRGTRDMIALNWRIPYTTLCGDKRQAIP